VSARIDAALGRSRALPWLVVACGVALLLVRVALIGVSSAAAALAAILVVLAAVSLITPVRVDTVARLPWPIVAGLGIAAVVGASAMLAGGIPLPHGPIVIALAIGAAVSEEQFFRRLVYGAIAQWHPIAAVVGSALLFALVHMPLYGAPVFWVDLGAGLLFSWQRWASGDWRAPAATHAVANVLAVVL
jgi:membrane protease YdiL (CAAX protease family)